MKKLLIFAAVLLALCVLWFRFGADQNKEVVYIDSSGEFSSAVVAVSNEFQRDLGTTIQINKKAGNDLIFAKTEEILAWKKQGEIREVIPIARHHDKSLSIGVLTTCPQPGAALRFARYMAAPEKGGVILKKLGFDPEPGDAWAEVPNLILYSGGVNRPAIEKLLTEFKDREGIELTSVFNGCGILCAAIQTMNDSENPRFPDAYFACDLCFIPPVAEHFPEVILLTETDIGIAVPIDNPHNIKTLSDLAKPNLKVGLCNQKQSTLGYMTGGILKSSGLEKSIRKNAAVEVPTADFLITQMRSGALDAAIVYRVNAELQKEHLKFIKIKHEGARAVQPFSVRVDSKKRQLAKRLQNHFLAHPEVFEETGFTWRGAEGLKKSAEIKVPDWLLGNGTNKAEN